MCRGGPSPSRHPPSQKLKAMSKKAVQRWQVLGVANNGQPVNLTDDPNSEDDLFAKKGEGVDFATSSPHLFPNGRFQVLPVFVLADAADPEEEEEAPTA